MGHGRDLFGVRNDGSEVAIEIGLNPLTLRDDTMVLASIVDVTERKRQEQELRTRVVELQRCQEEMEQLSEMSSLLQHALRADEAHEIVHWYAQRLIQNVDASIYEMAPSSQTLELRSSWGTTTREKQVDHLACWALRRTQTHSCERDTFPRCTHGWKAREAWQLCVPIAARGHSSGLICISSQAQISDKERFDLERVSKTIADHLALALSNIHLQETMRGLAIRDSLTGLYNRRYLDESAVRELQRAERCGSRVAVIMIDVDHFKEFNDTHGHQAADDALQAFGVMLMDAFRKEDIACRYGGEEFVLLLPDCSLNDALAHADSFQKKMKASSIGLTFSAGVAEYPQDGTLWKDVLGKADELMYEAKEMGRDRIRCSAPRGAKKGRT